MPTSHSANLANRRESNFSFRRKEEEEVEREWKKFRHASTLTYDQCDQITRLFAWFLAIYCNENVPNGISNLPKSSKHFAKYLMNPFKMAKVF